MPDRRDRAEALLPTTLDLSGSRTLIGVVLKMPGPAYVEMAGHFGADLVVIDTEHGVADTAQVEAALVRAGDSVPVPVLVRVPGHDAAAIQSALDAGAAGSWCRTSRRRGRG